MKKRGRIISLILVLMLILNSLPLGIFALNNTDLDMSVIDGAIDIDIDEDLLNVDNKDINTDIKDDIDINDIKNDDEATSDNQVDIKTISRNSYMDLNNDDVKDLDVIKKVLIIQSLMMEMETKS